MAGNPAAPVNAEPQAPSQAESASSAPPSVATRLDDQDDDTRPPGYSGASANGGAEEADASEPKATSDGEARAGAEATGDADAKP